MADFTYENSVAEKGYRNIIGIDEVGRGCLAGPLVAGAVMLDIVECDWLIKVNDSKKLSPKLRQELSVLIKSHAKTWGLGIIDSTELDRVGITKATDLAMKQAIKALNINPDYLLIDYVSINSWDHPYQLIKQGDSKSYSIAAASIIAKVYRDQVMIELDSKYPGYDFSSNKGYGTKYHMDSLSLNGPCEIHRRSFSPVQQSKYK